MYFDAASDYQQFNKTIAYLVKKIREHCPDAEAVAARGTSGSLVLMSVASKLKIPAIFIRKTGEQAHTSQHSRTNLGRPKNFVIVDDFVSSGKTVDAIIKGLRECSTLTEADCLAVFEYEDKRNRAERKMETPEGFYIKIYARR